MGSVNISIREEAYNFLRSLKSEDASFSEVILEFKKIGVKRKGSKEGIMEFFGILKDKNIDWKAKEKRMKMFRRDFDERFK